MSVSSKLLDGYIVLDLTDLSGQFCGKCLSDLGATVIMIESPSGSEVRSMGPFKDDISGDDRSLRFAFMNSGKMSLTLDLTLQEGKEMFLRLIDAADILVESGKPGQMQALGLGFDALSARNPRLIVTSVTGFGQKGPYSGYLAPHAVAFAMSGLMYIAGDPSSAPVLPPEYQGFYFSNIHAALGTLFALWEREKSGVGQHVDVSIQETLATQEHILRIFGSLGTNVRRQGRQHPFAAPASIFPTRDGYVFLFASRVHWPLLLGVWPDHPPEFAQPEWEPDIARREKVDLINEKVSEFTRCFGKEEFALLMQQKGIPCLPVNTPSDFARDEHIGVRGLIQQVDHPDIGTCEQVSFPVLIDGQRVAVKPAPRLGEHDDRLLAENFRPKTAAQYLATSVEGSKFLSGLTVVSLTAGVAGPSTARTLAQAGAEVIKVESMIGGLDSFRYYSTADDIEASGRFLENNLNVLSAQLNLKTPEGLKLFLELVSKADILVENFRPTVLPRLGLDLDTLFNTKPNLIYMKMPGMGSTGPKNWFGTWGQTLNAVSGMTYLWNHPGQEKPVGFQGAYPDYVAAALAPTAIMAALLRRQKTGKGAFLELAQAEMTAYILGVSYLEALANGHDPQPQGNSSNLAAPHDCFPCAGSDSWCFICVETDAQWQALCRVMEREDLLRNTDLATINGRLIRRDEVNASVARWTRSHERHDVMSILQESGVPAGAVQTGEDLYSDPQIMLRGLTHMVTHETLGDIPVATLPIHFSRSEFDPPRAMCSLGADNERVFCGILGYSSEQLAQWQAADVVK